MQIPRTKTVAIESAHTPQMFLSMDGRSVTTSRDGGSGSVSLQGSIGAWETFKLIEHEDGTCSIESDAFPNVFLRMDGRGVNSFRDGGAGEVNCQFGAMGWEKFRWEAQDDGSVAIVSVAFPGVYLRMNGLPETIKDGQARVNCQFRARRFEKFRIWYRT
jgi:hypothetical protein